MRDARRSRQVFYASTTIDGQQRLLLGPFTEKAVADTAVGHARELAYLRIGPVRPPVQVVPVFVPAGAMPVAGELNTMAMALAGPMLSSI